MIDVRSETALLSLHDIRLDGGTQSRAELDHNKIAEYAQLMLDGTLFPPVIVFYDGADYWLSDGFHRLHAKGQIGEDSIESEIKQGTLRDAVLHSMEANTRHGVPLPLADRKRCAKTLVDDAEWSQWSDREIGRRCGLSHVTVWSMRPVKNEQSVTEQPVEPPEDVPAVQPGRTNEEKRKSVENFFTEFPHLLALSNREIAKRCGVTEHLVRTIRKEVQRDEDLSPVTVIEGEPTVVEAMAAPVEIDVTPAAEPEQEKLPIIEPSEEIQRERETRRERTREQIELLREKGVDLPDGKYSCIVIDPPWSMQKIEREERPNQFEFDYPTMNEDQLRGFPLPDFAADDCHLYLWTTQKHLPLALRLAEHWGFRYQCLLTWVKNVGFTPFSWMYSTEHVLFCAKGSLPLMALGKRLDFSAKVREHSRKPDEFYDLVRMVSPGPRLDVFSREKREGFDQYGNEVEKYAVSRE